MPVAGAVIGAVGAVAGGALSAQGSKKAAQGQVDAANKATEQQWDMYQQQRTDQEPWRQAGTQALGSLLAGMGLDNSSVVQQNARTRDGFDSAAYLAANPDVAASDVYRSNPYQHWLDWGQNEGRAFTYTPAAQAQLNATKTGAQADGYGDLTRKFTLADFTTDPGYQFRLGEGQSAIERSAAARGGALSGGALKAIQQYGQNFASNEYGNAYNRFVGDQTNRFNRLSSLAGLGQTANNSLGAAAQNYGNNAASNILAAGNATSAGAIGRSNAYANGLNSLATIGSMYYMNQQPAQNSGNG